MTRTKIVKNIVPQGSPASPTLCNQMAQVSLDGPILACIEKKHPGWVYTRYSDDLSFSHPEVQSREAVNALIDSIRECIRAAGYRTNVKKTRVQRMSTRQHMLGMTINQHPNIPRHIYDRYKAILHNCAKQGFSLNGARYSPDYVDNPEGFVSHLQGKISYFQTVNSHRAQKLKKLLDHAVEKHRDLFEEGATHVP